MLAGIVMSQKKAWKRSCREGQMATFSDLANYLSYRESNAYAFFAAASTRRCSAFASARLV